MLVRLTFDHFDKKGKDTGVIISRLVECDSIVSEQSKDRLVLNLSKDGKHVDTFTCAVGWKEGPDGKRPDYERLLVFVMERGKTVDTYRFNWNR